MRILVSPRGTGKTKAIIAECAGNGGYIVCISQAEAHRIFALAQEMGKQIPLPITIGEFIRGEYHPAGVKRLLIDNADMLLQSIANVPIDMITMTYELPKIKQGY